jgi:glucose-6-phosphate 1-epimerase
MAVITLALAPSEHSRRHWPHNFDAAFTISVGKALDMALEVVNTSPAQFVYEEALHTYLAIGDIRRTSIEGLVGRQFIDKVDGGSRKTQPAGAFTLTGETDRVYVDTPDTVTVNDAANNRRLIVSKSGSASTVVWNPWIAKAKAMADFGDDEWPGMLCIETANAAENAVKLAPGANHAMRATVAVQ